MKPLSPCTLAALARMDALAAELGITTHTLAQYADVTGGYTKGARRARRDRRLPGVGSDGWAEVVRKVAAIAADCDVHIRYAICRRADLAKRAA